MKLHNLSLYLEKKKLINLHPGHLPHCPGGLNGEKLLTERKLSGKKFLILLPSFFLPSLLMRNSKQGITEMGRKKGRFIIIIIYYYSSRVTGKSKSSPAKSKSFVNEAVR